MTCQWQWLWQTGAGRCLWCETTDLLPLQLPAWSDSRPLHDTRPLSTLLLLQCRLTPPTTILAKKCSCHLQTNYVLQQCVCMCMWRVVCVCRLTNSVRTCVCMCMCMFAGYCSDHNFSVACLIEPQFCIVFTVVVLYEKCMCVTSIDGLLLLICIFQERF